jgi:hypothetical protein
MCKIVELGESFGISCQHVSFLNAGSKPSSSLCHTQMALQKFETGGLLKKNVRRYIELL